MLIPFSFICSQNDRYQQLEEGLIFGNAHDVLKNKPRRKHMKTDVFIECILVLLVHLYCVRGGGTQHVIHFDAFRTWVVPGNLRTLHQSPRNGGPGRGREAVRIFRHGGHAEALGHRS